MAARMTKRLQKEFEAIQKNADLKANLPTNDLKLWHVEFEGAKNTIYEGEHFRLQLRFNHDYVNSANNHSRSNLQKYSLLEMSLYISIFIPMALYAYQSFTMVNNLIN